MPSHPVHTKKESNTLKVYHPGDTINFYYDMSAPIQFTLSYCSGMSDDDYFNIMTVSPGEDRSLSIFRL